MKTSLDAHAPSLARLYAAHGLTPVESHGVRLALLDAGAAWVVAVAVAQPVSMVRALRRLLAAHADVAPRLRAALPSAWAFAPWTPGAARFVAAPTGDHELFTLCWLLDAATRRDTTEAG